MPILTLDTHEYCETEADLCRMHKASGGDTCIDIELAEIQRGFSEGFPQLRIREDYEFPSWHHGIRLFWVYLYSDAFYRPEFIPRLQSLVSTQQTSWFAQFECYSPSRQSSELPSGFVGDFLIYKDTVIFHRADGWSEFRPKLQV